MKKRLILIIIVIVASAGLVYAGYSLNLSLFEKTKTPPIDPGSTAGNNLKNYENKNLGYSFSYPGSWVIETNAGTVTFSNPEDLSEEINIAVSDAEYLGVTIESFSAYASRPVKIGGLDATAYSKAGDSLQAVLVVKDRKLFYLSGKSGGFEELLGGFKFIN